MNMCHLMKEKTYHVCLDVVVEAGLAREREHARLGVVLERELAEQERAALAD